MFLTIKLCTYAKHTYLKLNLLFEQMYLALNNMQRLICHKPTIQPTNL